MLFRMAWRNIWRNKPRSIIIITSVAIGLFAGVFVLSIYEGMIRARVKTVIRDEVSHIQLHNPAFKADGEAMYIIDSGNKLQSIISGYPEVENVTARSIANGMISSGNSSNGVEIRGVNPETEKKVSGLENKIVEGTYFTSAKNELLIGRKLLEKMKLKQGNKVVLTFTDKDQEVTAGAFRIRGVYQSTNTPLDERIVYVKATDLNDLLNTDSGIHQLAIVLKNDDMLESVAGKMRTAYPELLTETWKELSPETELTVTTVNQFSSIIIAIIMLALAFGITNTMLMAILERSRECGMMEALGMNKIRLFLMVLLETVLLTGVGVPLGILIAWIITKQTGSRGIDVTRFAGEVMAEFGYGNIIYPVFPWSQLPTVLIIVIVTALAAAIFPSVKILRLQPVDALRK